MGRADPLLPVQALGDGLGRRAVRPRRPGRRRPTVGLRDVADRPGPDVFAEPADVLAAVSLIAQLRDDLVLLRRRRQPPHLVDAVGHRLLQIDPLPQAHGDHRGHGVMVVRHGDEHRVHLLVKLVEHLPVVIEGLHAGKAWFPG